MNADIIAFIDELRRYRERMRKAAEVRDHFHAGATAALNASGRPDEQAEQIMRAADAYVREVVG
jgi:hypothetical protein